MKVQTTQVTIDAIKAVIEQQESAPNNVRIYIAGMGWSGPSFGLTLDELKEDDVKDDSNDVTFIMSKDLHDQLGDMLVDYAQGGYLVRPVVYQDSGCSSCAGGC